MKKMTAKTLAKISAGVVLFYLLLPLLYPFLVGTLWAYSILALFLFLILL